MRITIMWDDNKKVSFDTAPQFDKVFSKLEKIAANHGWAPVQIWEYIFVKGLNYIRENLLEKLSIIKIGQELKNHVKNITKPDNNS